MKNSIIQEKSYQFALRIVNAYKYLIKNKAERSLVIQLLRSGTSIGAQVEEALQVESKADFIHKFAIANKEASETKYWIRLMNDSEILESKLAQSLLKDAEEISRILISIIKTSKQNLKKKK